VYCTSACLDRLAEKVTRFDRKLDLLAGFSKLLRRSYRHFFGEPVKQADVQYYVYRSRYYPWWWADEDDAAADETAGEEDGGYGYGNDMVKDGRRF